MKNEIFSDNHYIFRNTKKIHYRNTIYEVIEDVRKACCRKTRDYVINSVAASKVMKNLLM